MKPSEAAHVAAVILAKTKNVRLRKIAARLIKIEAQLTAKVA